MRGNRGSILIQQPFPSTRPSVKSVLATALNNIPPPIPVDLVVGLEEVGRRRGQVLQRAPRRRRVASDAARGRRRRRRVVLGYQLMLSGVKALIGLLLLLLLLRLLLGVSHGSA